MPIDCSYKPLGPRASLLRASRVFCCLGLLLAAADARAFWGFGKKQAAEAAIQQAAEIVNAADAAWHKEDGDGAIELYTRAIDALLEIEAGQPNDELGPIRFRRAYCETQIDRIKFAQATKNERRVTVLSSAPTAPASVPAAALSAPAAAAPTPVATGAVAVAAIATATPTNAAPAGALAPAAPTDVAAEIAWARDMVKLDRLDEAAATLIRILKTDALNRSARLMLASVRCRQGSFADALIILEDLRGEREDEAVLLAIAGAYCGATRYYEALLALDRLLAANPRHPEANMNMAYLLLEMSPGRQQESERYYRQAVKLGAARDSALERRLGL